MASNTLDNSFNLIKNSKNNTIYIILNNTTIKYGYQFFRTINFNYNPFIKQNKIS